MNQYEEYFNMQVGGGTAGGVGRIYIGTPYQRGHGGIGSFLAGIFRRVLPLVTRGAKAVGKEALRTGMNIMSDVTTRNIPIKESFRNRARESGDNLKRKAEEKIDKLMEGSGYKRPHLNQELQLFGNSVALHRTKKRKKRSTKIKLKTTKRGKISKRRKVSKKKNKRKPIKRTTRDIFG